MTMGGPSDLELVGLITAQIKRRMLRNVTLGLSGLLTTRKITVWFPTKLGIPSQGLKQMHSR